MPITRAQSDIRKRHKSVTSHIVKFSDTRESRRIRKEPTKSTGYTSSRKTGEHCRLPDVLSRNAVATMGQLENTKNRRGRAAQFRRPPHAIPERRAMMRVVAAIFLLLCPTEDRGVYRSKEAAQHGPRFSTSLRMRARSKTPRILYAAFWDHRRTPWEVRNGGPGSGIDKSTDGARAGVTLEEGSLLSR
jgi:hypothetical protein